jgi:signal transduction histidine kinase
MQGLKKWKGEKTMKKTLVILWLSLFLLSMGGTVLASGNGTAQEAEALVKKAISYIKAQGQEKAFAEISNSKGSFVDRDLYIFVYDMNGKCIAHGANQKMIGKDLREMKDTDGKSYVKERIEIAKSKGKGWQDYKFTNPLSKKIEAKTAYIEKLDDMIVGCGIYK